MRKQPPPPPVSAAPEDPREAAVARRIQGFFDSDWYSKRYPDVVASDLSPIIHFIRHGLAEQRDPNAFFDSGWYLTHYPDVSAGGIHPLVHYLQSGATEQRNPHPNFDAIWYVDQHPEAAGNPLVYHLRIGRARNYPTEKPVRTEDYLPSTGSAPRLPANCVVDIVIPVYRGLEETRRCIASVLADPGKPLGRVIVVEDASPDKRLIAWLADLTKRNRIVLLRNRRNLGFVGSVNRGMEAAGDRDVVLLNSDTEVPPGWLVRLAAQAYAGRRIATVSPLSNNATICSYPHNGGAPIPLGHTLRDLDDACRTANAGRFVDAPTTVGFCMYIRREALQRVGNFDAERFTVGYGEENDFCLRATALGWQHRIACDTFVYHQGAVSFGDRTEKLRQRAMALILERYPSYQRDVAGHVRSGEINPFRFAVTAALFRQAKLPVILMIAHGLGGGVRRHIDTLVRRFADRARFLLLQATDRGASLSVPSLPDHPTVAFSTASMDDLLALLRSMHVSRVHIHHLLGMDIDVEALVHRLAVPFDVTVHDYYAICPQINLLPWRYSLYCGEPDVAGCNTCIANRMSHGARDIVTWRAERAWQFREAARVLCPSHDVLSRLQRFGLAENAVLAPHEPVEARPWRLRLTPPAASGKIRIAVLGTLVNHKGARAVAAVAELADPKIFEFHLIGHTDGPFPERALKRMKVTGQYDDADLADLIAKTAPHVIWFPAVWPESFNYTLSAAIEAGIPIAATDIGSHTERLLGRPFTWLAEIGISPAAWIDLFRNIASRLAAGRPGGKAPIRTAVKDFYALHYLEPEAAARPSQPVRPRIAVIPERFDAGFPTPCAYIRLLQPMYHPSIEQNFQIVTTTAASVFHYEVDIIVTQRYAVPDLKTADRLAAHVRRTGATLVYDLDDDLLAIPSDHPDAKVLRPRAKVIRRMLDVADHVLLSTPGLAHRLSAIRPDAMVLENGLDERIWTPPAPELSDQPVRILCMGTTTHDQDFKLIEPALTRLKAEYGDRVVIDVVGMTSESALPPGLNRISASTNGRRSYPGFVRWLTTMQPRWHIGLAPLLDTPFNRTKSAVKAMDYAAMGLVVLASDVPAYRGSIADGPAGLLIPNAADAWYQALDQLLRDRDRRRAIGASARAAFLARSSLESQARLRRSAWTRLLDLRRTDAA